MEFFRGKARWGTMKEKLAGREGEQRTFGAEGKEDGVPAGKREQAGAEGEGEDGSPLRWSGSGRDFQAHPEDNAKLLKGFLQTVRGCDLHF